MGIDPGDNHILDDLAKGLLPGTWGDRPVILDDSTWTPEQAAEFEVDLVRFLAQRRQGH